MVDTDLGRRFVENGMDGSEERTPAFVVEDQDDGGPGQIRRVVPMFAFGLSEIGNGSVQADLVGDQLVEAVNAFKSFFFLFLIDGQGVSFAHLTGPGRHGFGPGLEVANFVGACRRKKLGAMINE